MKEFLSKLRKGRRVHDDRREQTRETPERRKMRGVRVTISSPTDVVEVWLQQNCRGDHELVFIDVSDDLNWKTIEVMFSNDEDRDRFNANLHEF